MLTIPTFLHAMRRLRAPGCPGAEAESSSAAPRHEASQDFLPLWLGAVPLGLGIECLFLAEIMAGEDESQATPPDIDHDATLQ
jgi:hypothetical protein